MNRLRDLILSVLVMLCAIPSVAHAKDPEAVIGQPYSVAEFSIPLAAGADPASVQLIDPAGRILYPAVAAGRFGEIAGALLGDPSPSGPSQVNVSFLFIGDEPLEVTALTPQPQTVVLRPQPPRRPKDYDKALKRWWKDYNAVVRRQEGSSDYPPIVETYLTSMLSGRFGLRPPLLTRMQAEERSELENLASLLFGVEQLRFAIMRETMAGSGGLGETATIPLPAEVQWQPLALPNQQPQVGVEPIAMHVPQECYYIRFGSFENYLWFDHLKDDYGGNLSQLITLRGHHSGLDEKVQRQLALKQSELSEVMGPQVISDVALIGRDLYLREGPALGVLFEAKNTALLKASFEGDRNAIFAEQKNSGATLQTVSIAGHDVSFLSTPDNRLRSFHAIDGDYHLVTTSRAIVERFFAAGEGQGALGAAAEFQHARWEMPLEREDTIFGYLSSAFFRGLLSPQYQIELTRRLQSVTDMELLQLARLAAGAEGQPHDSVDRLIAGGFLPPGFGRRGRGGPPVESDHGFFDPQRGARGHFTPIPDVPLTAITPTESALYNRASQFVETQWPQMDPLMFGVKRFALDQERLERVVIDANVSPIAEEKYGWVLSMLGPPVDVTIQSDPTDVVTAQMSLKGGLLWPQIPAHQLFLGIQDLEPTINPVPDGFLKTLNILQTTPGYLGAWPQMGLLDLIPFLAPHPDVFGFSQLPLGLWRWQGGGFSVVSFHQPVLAEAATFLEPVPTDNPAQIQLRISDLFHSRLAGWINWLNYNRTFEASRGNVHLLNTLTQQLRVAPETALATAHQLLDTTLVCPLGGEYEFTESPSGGHWRSTAWDGSPMPPPDYVAPLLEWFRGASVNLTMLDHRMWLHAEVDMLRKERQPAPKLPLFDLFGGAKERE